MGFKDTLTTKIGGVGGAVPAPGSSGLPGRGSSGGKVETDAQIFTDTNFRPGDFQSPERTPTKSELKARADEAMDSFTPGSSDSKQSGLSMKALLAIAAAGVGLIVVGS
jgi:hypothetical protein